MRSSWKCLNSLHPGAQACARPRLTSPALPPASLSRRTAPLGPMPNEDIDVSNLERLEKYRSFDRYRRRAEPEARKPHWWRTYREYLGKEPGAGPPEQGLLGAGLGVLAGADHLLEHSERGAPPAFPCAVGDVAPPGFFTPLGPPVCKIPFPHC